MIATWEREGREGERAFFLEAWNGNQAFDTDRIGRGHIRIPNVCVSIFGGIQPDKLTAYLEQATHGLANDGMLQRFQLLVYPDPVSLGVARPGAGQGAPAAAVTVFEALADFDPVAWGAAPADDLAKFPHFRFGDEAQASASSGLRTCTGIVSPRKTNRSSGSISPNSTSCFRHWR